MNDNGRGRSRLLARIGHVRQWHPRSHGQAWLFAVSGYLACAITFPLIGGWANHPFSFIGLAAPWIGVGAGQSYEVERRRSAAAQG
jgi:hypothetical protein